MRRVFVIVRKEMLDSIRDRRTLLMMVAMPLLLVPGIIILMVKLQTAQMEKAETRQHRIVFVGEEVAPALYTLFQEDEHIYLVPGIHRDSIAAMIADEHLDGAVIVPPEFDRLIAGDKQGRMEIIFKGVGAFGSVEDRMQELIASYAAGLVEERIARLQLDPDLFDAIAVEDTDLASMQEKLAEAVGGFLPYMFIIFGFMGAMYPGIDLGAGEKERGTLETLLSTPAGRFEIVLGKFIVVMTAGVATALIAMLGLYLGVRSFPEIPTEIFDVIMEMLGPKMILLILTLILPVSAFFAAVILGLSFYARSFKEAQSIIAPLNIAIIIPAVIGTIPGIELNATLALVPILNVSLATKDLLAGNINMLYLSEVYVSLFLLAGLSLWGCALWFNREATLFRS